MNSQNTKSKSIKISNVKSSTYVKNLSNIKTITYSTKDILPKKRR